MAKAVQTYTLFIAAPSDIVAEKDIIRDCANQWNRFVGNHQQVQIEVKDWSDTYPLYGNRPQAFINDQIFDESDFAVALFWAKFGSPTGVATSGTEEEILRAIDQGKHLLLYFKTADVPINVLSGNDYSAVVAFRSQHAGKSLYREYKSDDAFRQLFLDNLANFMNDLMKGKLNKKDTSSSTDIKGVEEVKEKDETGAKYEAVKEIEKRIKENFPSYWAKLYGIADAKSVISDRIKITIDIKEQVKQIKSRVADWERQVNGYSDKLQMAFAALEELGADELQNDILPEELWTVGTALASRDNELWLFQQHYQQMESYKIKDTVKNIIKAVEYYKSQPPQSVNGNTVNKPEALGFDILKPDETLLTGVIGKGIRSEMLHKLSPKYFSLMTRRSVWALFFLSNQAGEFVVDQSKDGLWRTVHNWDYLYDRFTYYNHIVFQLMHESLSKHKIILNPELKYGFANLFLVDIFKSHDKDIEKLKKLKKVL